MPDTIQTPPTPPKSKTKLLLAILIPIGIIAGLGIGYVIANAVYNANNSSTSSISKTTSLNSSQQEIVKDTNFPIDLYKNLLTLESNGSKLKDKNLLISPTSIELALLMAYEGSSGTTKTEFENVMALKTIDFETLNTQIKTRITNLNTPIDGVTLNIANSVFYRNNLTFKSSYLDTIKSTFGADLYAKDFSKASTLNDINNWVSQKTNGKIPTIIDKINDGIVMYLLNAVYFNGTWKFEFDKTLTESRLFHQDSITQSYTNFMYQTRKDFQYYEDDVMKEVKLFYGKDQKYSMIIMLPKKDLTDFYNNFTSTKLAIWLNSFENKEGKLYLPKFKTEFNANLNDSLKALGLNAAFDTAGNADFTNIRSEKDLFISNVIHKTYIDVNEVGTEAAAVTAIEMGITAIRPDDTFIMDVNTPFFYMLRDERSAELLFMGQVVKPEYK